MQKSMEKWLRLFIGSLHKNSSSVFLFLCDFSLHPSIAQIDAAYNPDTVKPLSKIEGVCTNWLPAAVGAGSSPRASISSSIV